MESHHSDEPCEVCGSAAIESMKTCVRCNAREHAYCTQNPNLIYSEDWLCEACIPEQHASRKRYISTSDRQSRMIFLEEVVDVGSNTRQKVKPYLATSSSSGKSKSKGQSSQSMKSTPPSQPLKAQVDPCERAPRLDLTPRSERPRSSFQHNEKRKAASTETEGPKGTDSEQSSLPTNEAQDSSLQIEGSAREALGIYAHRKKRAVKTIPQNEWALFQQLKKHIGENSQKDLCLLLVQTWKKL